MRNIKLTIEYDGTKFCGWQIQAPNRRTVQGEIEKALKKIFHHPTKLFGSGRTDSGVHALGQVANFQTVSPLATAAIVKALNANLPEDISILNAVDVPLDFHAQFNAKRKTYRYIILNRKSRGCVRRQYEFYCSFPLDIQAMRKAAQCLKGRKDFRSFMATDPAAPKDKCKDTVRHIYRLQIKKQNDTIFVDIEANGFLYKMVRNIVGILLETGKKKILPNQVSRILSAQSRQASFSTAPAHGLTLIKVNY